MKKYLLGVIALVFAIGAVAFTNQPTKKLKNTEFVYVGTDANQYDQSSAWQVYSSQSCSGGTHVCRAIADNSNITDPADFAALIDNAGGTEADVDDVATIVNSDKGF